MRLLSVLLLSALSGLASAQKVPLGAPAPKVGATKAVQGKPLAGFERGRVYVLEFWATWCGSCRPAMPHLSELATRFAGKPVEIYSVSDEAPAKIEPFLRAFPTKTQVVGGAGELFESLGVRLLPTTVLIDREGRVAAFTKPEAVTETVVDALLKGERIDVPLASDKPADFGWDREIAADSLEHVVLRFSDSDGGGQRIPPNSGRITADGSVLSDLYRIAYHADYVDTQWRAPKDETRYRVSVKAPDAKDDTARAMLGDALARAFGLHAGWQDVEREVYVLRVKGPVSLKPSTGPSDQGGARRGSIVWSDADAKTLASLLGSYGVGTTVVDETGLTGRYALAIEWTPGERASLVKALSSLGLDLTKETRRVPTLVVEAASR